MSLDTEPHPLDVSRDVLHFSLSTRDIEHAYPKRSGLASNRHSSERPTPPPVAWAGQAAPTPLAVSARGGPRRHLPHVAWSCGRAEGLMGRA
jgi:hypothetical protein